MVETLFWIQYRAERKTVQSVTFIAKKGIEIDICSEESQVVGMIIDATYNRG